MKKLYYSLCFFLLMSTFTHAEKRKILFLGNSYTYVNDLPNTLKQLALSLGDTLDIDSYCPGGASFQSLYNDANTLTKIQLPGWDYVVLQAQSQEPSFSPAQVQTDTYPFAKKLDSLIHLSNPCAETVFYMTWGRKNGDAGNCAAYPPVCTYEGMQQRLRESYLEMSNDNDATCSPVGMAWRTFRTQYPSVELYNPDQSHPSVNGTYLAACVFYTSLYQKSTVGASYVLAGVQATDAPNIQSIASATVLDSLENWQQYGHLPYADFSFSVNQNQVTFTNNSLRAATYDWDFGDGSPINNTINPTHTYTAVGNYTVSLQAKSNCNKFARKNKQVSINTIPNTLDDLDNSLQKSIFYSEGKLFLQGSFTEVMVINLHGDRVLLDLNKTKRPYVGCDYLPIGVYFYRAIDKEQHVVMGKFVKE